MGVGLVRSFLVQTAQTRSPGCPTGAFPIKVRVVAAYSLDNPSSACSARSGTCRHPLGKGHLEAQCLQALGEPDLHFLAGSLVEVAGAEVDVYSPIGQQVIGDDQDCVSERDYAPFAAASCRQPMVQGGEVSVSGTSCGEGGFNKNFPEGPVAFAGPSRARSSLPTVVTAAERRFPRTTSRRSLW